MILVTLGTQQQQFTRLLEEIEKTDIREKIIVQAGYTKFESEKMELVELIPYEEMNELIEKASLIITHGGTGSIISPLKKGKIVIACARLNKYGEHVDDHQTQIVDVFNEEGYILKLDDNQTLAEVLKKAKKFKPKKFVSNTDNFINSLKEEINKKN